MLVKKTLTDARNVFRLTTLAIAVPFLFSCNSADNNASSTQPSDSSGTEVKREDSKPSADMPSLKPKGPKPEWASDIDDNMAVIIEKLGSYGDPPIETVTGQKARTLHTPTDAVMDVMKENNVMMPPPACDTMGKDIPVQGGMVHARIYTPKNASDSLPLIVYFHGGGWVIADLNTYDASAKALCEQVNAVVVSVHYRQGPEFKFPTAHNDAFAAYQWALKNAGMMHASATRVAVVGESAGGNLACNVSIMARDKGITQPLYQVLVYPVASNDMNSPAYQKYAAAKPLNKPMMEWFARNYLGDMARAADTRISLVNAKLNGLPGTTIIAAEIDPLASDGEMLRDKLQAAGVRVNYKAYEGVTHEFFGMATLLQDAKDAQALAAADLKTALSTR